MSAEERDRVVARRVLRRHVGARDNARIEPTEERFAWLLDLARPSRKGGRYAARGTSFARQLRRALKHQGVTRRELFEPTERTLPVDVHSIRRLYITSLAAGGVNQMTGMALAGHSSAAVHAKYVRATDAMRTVPALTLEGFDFGVSGLSVSIGRVSRAASGGFLNDFSGVDGTRTRGLRRDSSEGSDSSAENAGDERKRSDTLSAVNPHAQPPTSSELSPSGSGRNWLSVAMDLAVSVARAPALRTAVATLRGGA